MKSKGKAYRNMTKYEFSSDLGDCSHISGGPI